MSTTAFVSWPSAPFTRRLVLDALGKLEEEIVTADAFDKSQYDRLIQWSTYDEIDHELTNVCRGSVLASSYTFRKALIRKHYLAHSIHAYLTKYPTSILRSASPQTYDLDLAFADELDEKWADDLYELGGVLENETHRWWILKPGMADRGMGIRLFNTKEALHEIFQESELCDSEDEDGFPPGDETSDVSRTTVVTSQLRHFVIQEYILSPLLFDPREVPLNDKPRIPDYELRGHKFHLRAYCVASGALQLYLYDRILALFCSAPYTTPGIDISDREESYPRNLRAHLTNTSLQTDREEESVRLFDELIGCRILNEDADVLGLFTKDDRENIIQQMTRVVAETFRAALQFPVHFQPLENAFELYGVDFLVEHMPSSVPMFQVKILEINAEPAIELTGRRLTWILEDLFASIARVCVNPFIRQRQAVDMSGTWNFGETKEHFIKCLDEVLRAGLWDRGPPS